MLEKFSDEDLLKELLDRRGVFGVDWVVGEDGGLVVYGLFDGGLVLGFDSMSGELVMCNNFTGGEG